MGNAVFPVCPEATSVDLEKLQGVWFVVRTNLEMWKTKRSPQITYTNLSCSSSRTTFDDTVRYYDNADAESRNIISTISGVDTEQTCPSKCAHSVFQWRGNCLLKLITSDWHLAAASPSYDWAITVFEATPFTAAGLDVYSREPFLTEAQLNAIQKCIDESPYLTRRAIGIFDAIQVKPLPLL